MLRSDRVSSPRWAGLVNSGGLGELPFRFAERYHALDIPEHEKTQKRWDNEDPAGKALKEAVL